MHVFPGQDNKPGGRVESVYTQKDPGSIQEMFSRIAYRYDLANTLLSFGCDSWWRFRVGALVEQWKPAAILDLATGSGVLAHRLKRQMPMALVVAADFCAPMLAVARRRGLTDLVVADGLTLPFRDRVFDVVTIAFGLRNMAAYETALSEAKRVLCEGGRLVILDFSLPSGPLRTLYRLYLHHVLPVYAGIVTGEPGAYRYFADSIESFPKGEEMLELFRRCGFSKCEATPLTMGIVTVYTGRVPCP
jgi:demethylmenaquinone methyltransferase / 2-methoxy-6-polyprenyl-1,4-benzoquinol methylase